jgi:hypothetical protein
MGAEGALKMNWKKLTRHPRFVPITSSLGFHVLFIVLSMWIHVSRPYAAPEEELLRFNMKSVDTRPLLLKHTSAATNPDAAFASRRFMKQTVQGSAAIPKDVPVEALTQRATESTKKAPELAPKRVELEEEDVEERPEIQSLLAETESRHTPDAVKVKQKSTSGVSETQRMVQKHRTNVGQLVQSLAKPLEKLGLG